MSQFNPLKYRGVFDRPIISTKNLLPSREMTVGEEIKQEHREPATPASTSEHVLKFFGFSIGRGKPKYLGTPSKASILDQREQWMEIWLQKGRYA
jgi:hypothetical protein